jgi:cytochrome c biogenesis protein CcdA
MILLFHAILAGLTAVLAPCFLSVFLVSLGLTLDRHGRPWVFVLGFVLSFGFFAPPLLAFGQLGPFPDTAFQIIGGIALVTIGVAAVFLNYLRSRRAPGTTLISQDKTHDEAFFWPVIDLLGGLAMGMLWTPCAGSLFRSILVLAESGQFTTSSGVYFGAYAFGLGISIVFFDRILSDVLRRLRKRFAWGRYIPVFMGGVIILVGLEYLLGADLFVSRFLYSFSPFTLFAL